MQSVYTIWVDVKERIVPGPPVNQQQATDYPLYQSLKTLPGLLYSEYLIENLLLYPHLASQDVVNAPVLWIDPDILS